MPFGGLGAPPPAHGITNSPPLNLGIGGAVAAGSNALVGGQFGLDVAGVALGITMVFNTIKQHPRFNQHVWAPVVLVGIGLVVFIVMQNGDLVQAIPKACAAAWQSQINYVSQKAMGLGGLTPTLLPIQTEHDATSHP